MSPTSTAGRRVMARSLQEGSESPVMSRCNSLSSSCSLTGAPQRITEWLVLSEKDPVEVLLELGFGTEEPDVCTRIPSRFLSGASVAKGINIGVFLEAQKQRMDIETPDLYERFRQLEVFDHVTSALSSLLADVNTQQTKAQDTGGDQISHLCAMKNRPMVTRAKWRRIGQLLKRASRQTVSLKDSSLAPEEANLPGKKEQLHSCADIAEKGLVQVGFSAHVRLVSLTQEQNLRDKGALAYPTSHCPLTQLGKTWVSLDLGAKQPLLSLACEVPAKDRPRKDSPLLVAHMLKKVGDLSCKLPDSFEMEEIQSLEDETPYGNASDTTSAEVMVTRTSSCQSDSSGFMEELPEPVILQNVPLSMKTDFFSDTLDQETDVSHRTVFPLLNQVFQQKPDDCVAKCFITACESVLTVPRSTKACSDQREDAHQLLTVENGKYQAYNTKPQIFEEEMLCDKDKKEDKTGRKQQEKEEFTKEHSPHFQDDTLYEGDPCFSEIDHHLYFSTKYKKVNDLNPAVISESKIRSEDEGERCVTQKDVGVACHESAHQGCTRCITGPCWEVEAVSKDGALLALSEVKNRQKFCSMDGDSKNTRCFPKKGLPETPLWGSAAQSGSRAASRYSLPVSQRYPFCLEEGPGLSSSEAQKADGVGEMLGVNKSEQEVAVQNGEMTSTPLKSVTVQMSSGLEFNSRFKCTEQDGPASESLSREDIVDFSDTSHSYSDPLKWSDPGVSKDAVKQISEVSSQTDTHARWPPLFHLPQGHLTKSASLDTMFCGKHRSNYWCEASGAGHVQGSCHCHCCCCHGCCLWSFPRDVSPHCPVGCCSNHASTQLQLLKILTVLQDTEMSNFALCTLQEIEAMKSSCQRFQDKLDEIERHLMEQQMLFSSAMPDEGREEGRHLQLLRRAVRQEVAELEFQLNDQTCQVREDILMQLDQLLVEQSHLFSELGLSEWKGERKAPNKQEFPDAADTVHLQSGCSEIVLQSAPSKTTPVTGSVPALKPGAPPVHFPTRTTPEPNSADSGLQEFSTSKKETKVPPHAKMDLKAFLHDVRDVSVSPSSF
ncbi:LOW QUALITY PROTEIN: protein ITPRID1 [Heliangelus exortis]|uniref:LOW QUALITY PROTEIN: protein ITPRID1 n=1 Tax=Heliangelus exortis TaxID=472823 RepID=UPI003A8F279F